jgi:Cys-tRNA(Pro) deacylase
MEHDEYPVTQGVRVLRGLGIPFQPLLYKYQEHGGTGVAAKSFDVPEHIVIKTLVFRTDSGRPFLVLMHGDLEASPKRLARAMEVKHVELCDAKTARTHTGYIFGGTSPLGTRTPLPVLAERTIFDLPSILINGGKQGFLVRMDPKDLKKALGITEVEVSIQPE